MLLNEFWLFVNVLNEKECKNNVINVIGIWLV